MKTKKTENKYEKMCFADLHKLYNNTSNEIVRKKCKEILKRNGYDADKKLPVVNSNPIKFYELESKYPEYEPVIPRELVF